jgi:glutaredoxin
VPQIEVFTGPGCSYCEAAKALLRNRKVFADGEHVGGLDDLRLWLRGLSTGA